MNIRLLAFLLLLNTSIALSQNVKMKARSIASTSGKPPVETGALQNWLTVKPNYVEAKAFITRNGKYVYYKMREHWTAPASLVVQSLDGNWKQTIEGVEEVTFTGDQEKIVFLKRGDSLRLLTLGTAFFETLSGVRSFRLFEHGDTEYLAFMSGDSGKELRLRNLKTGSVQSFSNTSEYHNSKNGKTLVVKSMIKDSIESITWVDIAAMTSKLVWEGKNISNIVIDENGSRLAFKGTAAKESKEVIGCWYYSANKGSVIHLVKDVADLSEAGFFLEEISHFDKDGGKLFVRLKERQNVKPNSNAVKVDVWSYTDVKLQTQQMEESRWGRSYLSVMDLEDGQITRLLQKDDLQVGSLGDTTIIVTNQEGNASDAYWNRRAGVKSFLINISKRDRRQLNVHVTYPRISPDGRFFLDITSDFADWNSYEVATGVVRNLTKALPFSALPMIQKNDQDRPRYKNGRNLWFAGWVDNGGLLLVDEYDIWLLDPAGCKTPVNLTNGYGRKNKIEFRLPGFSQEKVLSSKGELILTSFNRKNKNSGFYRISLAKKADPQLLSSGPFHYEVGYNGATQVKAADADVYVLMRESATASPNYFLTRDFKTFTALSNVNPEKDYNWLTSELVSFTTLDGRAEQAIIYKPENFDANKKYPVILHYYERKTEELNYYHIPGHTNGGHLDIPWFVGREYIVVVPDIHFEEGKIGKGAMNSIMGVAKFISRYNWVDSKRIGLQGYSFGGFETNYVVSHTPMFAAAVTLSGSADMISGYGTTLRGGNHSFYEMDQPRMGGSLWEYPERYIGNSPIFKAHKVVTPMMLISNKRDANVSFNQGLEWFVALRRLGKKAWMLQYDEQSHGVGGEDYKDYILRMTQFFDHYLKGAPAPKWMTRGIPAQNKGIDSGLDLDHEIITPGDGLLTPEQKNKVETLGSKKLNR